MKSEKILDLAVCGISFCENGGTLDDFLDFQLEDNDFRSVVSSILFTYFRNKAILDFAIGMFTRKNPSDFLMLLPALYLCTLL